MTHMTASTGGPYCTCGCGGSVRGWTRYHRESDKAPRVYDVRHGRCTTCGAALSQYRDCGSVHCQEIRVNYSGM
jgi:hypothetical protein